jgi:anaerobic ribonucleoside-triphosphate reductase activating protein
MRVHAIAHASRVNGPGLRSVVWVQGCQNMGPNRQGHCAGCWNPQLWDAAGGTEYGPVYLADQIFAHCAPGTQGLTISGGEPMQHPELLALINAVKARRPDWSIGIFTGYSHRELENGDYCAPSDERIANESLWDWKQRRYLSDFAYHRRDLWLFIKARIDFAIMGRFDRTQPTGPGALVSSKNQRIELFSMRYTLADFSPLAVEVSIDDTGMTQITGFPV